MASKNQSRKYTLQGTHTRHTIGLLGQSLTISQARRRFAVMHQLTLGEHLSVQAKDKEDAAEEERQTEQCNAVAARHLGTLQAHQLQSGSLVSHQCHC